MSSLFESYETNAKKEAEGVEVPFAPNQDGSVPTFILAATSKANAKYAKQLNAATKPYRRNMDAMQDEVAERIYKDVFCKTVLKGWRNVQVPAKHIEQFKTEGVVNVVGANSNVDIDVTYSIENAIKLFTLLPRLYDDLVQRAASIELFRETQREGEAGN